jgi:hypothetical protein
MKSALRPRSSYFQDNLFVYADTDLLQRSTIGISDHLESLKGNRDAADREYCDCDCPGL